MNIEQFTLYFILVLVALCLINKYVLVETYRDNSNDELTVEEKQQNLWIKRRDTYILSAINFLKSKANQINHNLSLSNYLRRIKKTRSTAIYDILLSIFGLNESEISFYKLTDGRDQIINNINFPTENYILVPSEDLVPSKFSKLEQLAFLYIPEIDDIDAHIFKLPESDATIHYKDIWIKRRDSYINSAKLYLIEQSPHQTTEKTPSALAKQLFNSIKTLFGFNNQDMLFFKLTDGRDLTINDETVPTKNNIIVPSEDFASKNIKFTNVEKIRYLTGITQVKVRHIDKLLEYNESYLDTYAKPLTNVKCNYKPWGKEICPVKIDTITLDDIQNNINKLSDTIKNQERTIKTSNVHIINRYRPGI